MDIFSFLKDFNDLSRCWKTLVEYFYQIDWLCVLNTKHFVNLLHLVFSLFYESLCLIALVEKYDEISFGELQVDVAWDLEMKL